MSSPHRGNQEPQSSYTEEQTGTADPIITGPGRAWERLRRPMSFEPRRLARHVLVGVGALLPIAVSAALVVSRTGSIASSLLTAGVGLLLTVALSYLLGKLFPCGGDRLE